MFTHDGIKLYYEVYRVGEPLPRLHGNGGSIAKLKNSDRLLPQALQGDVPSVLILLWLAYSGCVRSETLPWFGAGS
jgi:hypothetical protein